MPTNYKQGGIGLKQINLTMDQNGHVSQSQSGGVMGDHHAAELQFILDAPLPPAEYFRLYFAGEGGTLMTEQLFLTDNRLRYTLPAEVTGLGQTVLCQLCGYAGTGEQLQLLFKSDTVPLTFGTTLPQPDHEAQGLLTDRLNAMLVKAEAIAQNFDMQIGAVTTVAYDHPASVTLEKTDNMVYRLHFSLPKGEKGDGDFTPGKRVTIQNGEISVDSRAEVYQATTNLYGHLIIAESKTLEQLKGTVFFVNPYYTNESQTVSFGTTGEGIFYQLLCYRNNAFTNTVPIGAVVPNRVMAIYVTEEGKAIYMNPYEPPVNPLPIYTATPNTANAYRLEIANLNNQDFVGGKTAMITLTAPLTLNANTWYGPENCPLRILNGTTWETTQRLTGKTIPTGQSLMLYLEFQPKSQTYSTIKWLNPPV